MTYLFRIWSNERRLLKLKRAMNESKESLMLKDMIAKRLSVLYAIRRDKK